VVLKAICFEMKKIILFAMLPMLFSCGVSDERIDAYERATKKVKKASSSEALEMIAYDLHKELYEIDAKEDLSLAQMKSLAVAGNEECKEVVEAVDKARYLFDEALSDKETVYYLERITDNKGS
jgi:hypothetical protein